MNELKHAIIIYNYDHLLFIDNLNRLINQFKLFNINDVTIVTNKKIKNLIKHDVKINNNIKDTLNNINDSAIVMECNFLMENDMIKYITGSDFEKKSVLFSLNNFKTNNNFFINSDEHAKVIDVSDKEINYYNIFSGIIRISNNDLINFKKHLNKNIDNYYLPFIASIKDINYEEAIVSQYKIFDLSINKNYNLLVLDIDKKEKCPSYDLVEISKLHDIEDHDKDRVNKLINIINEDNIWNLPIIVEKEYNMVLDGHHRLNSARKMNYKRIPVIYVDYNKVKVWSLRKEYKVSQILVKEKVIDNNEIYPYKTVKHQFPFVVSNIKVSLNNLK